MKNRINNLEIQPNFMKRSLLGTSYISRFLVLFPMLLICFSLVGQQEQQFNTELRQLIKPNSLHDFLWFKEKTNLSAKTIFTANKQAFQLGQFDMMKITRIERDDLGFTHYRFKQYYKGLQVENITYLVHERNGRVKSANGRIVTGLNLNIIPQISESDALQMALNSVNAETYMWETPGNERFLKELENDTSATYYPKAELVIVDQEMAYDPSNYSLAYKFDIYAEEPVKRLAVYVDANSGEIIKHISTICGVTHYNGIAFTKYSGVRTIKTQLSGGNYILKDSTRGNKGIETYDMKNGTNYGAAVNFTDPYNIWTNDGVADAHWGAEVTYDYFKNVHARNSYDDSGAAIKSYVHYKNNYNNAFWNGSVMTYGDGDGNSFSILTSLDVVGHEITHAVTQKTAGLVYQSEAGALNESFSDIFATAIEFYIPGMGDWLIGDDIMLRSPSLRNMKNPKAQNQPNTYGGTNWINTTACVPVEANDYCGVHFNSGVQNRWFYLLSMGGSGKNDKNDKYDVKAIGINKAAKIAYRNLSVYLNANSNFNAARTGSVQAAKDMFGNCSVEALQVANAWHAVGVGNPSIMIDSFHITDASCNDTNGQAYIKIKGVSGTPTYLWSNAKTTQTIDSLVKGNYSVRITDTATNCYVDTTLYVGEDVNFTVSIFKVDITTCGGNDGSALAFTDNNVNGTPTYLWSIGATNNFIGNLNKGIYIVTVTDTQTNCQVVDSIEILEPRPDLLIKGAGIRTFCDDDPNTTVNLTAETVLCAGCTYLWSTAASTKTITVNSSGTYSITITDQNGCQNTKTESLSIWIRACDSTNQWEIPIIRSQDPNEIIGPAGYGPGKMVSVNDVLPYIIRFENDPDFATAPAQKVIITVPIDSSINMYSLRLGDFGFGDFRFHVPQGSTFFTDRMDVSDSLGVLVDIIAGLDVTKRLAFWIFESLDPNTLVEPDDASLGFLLVNDSITHRGEGFVTFTLEPDENSNTGDSIHETAKIVFDINEPIYTNVTFNIIDAVAPSSTVDSFVPKVDSLNYKISWNATDDAGGSGVASYDLFVSENNSTYSLLEDDIVTTSILYSGNLGSVYKFYTLATDNVGNQETPKSQPEAIITIVPSDFMILPDTNTNVCAGDTLTIQWEEIDLPKINIKVSADSAGTFTQIAANVDIEDTIYNWVTPDTMVGGNYLILFTNADNDYHLDTSEYFRINSGAIVYAGLDTAICLGETVTIGGSPTATGTPPYSYSWLPAGGLDSNTISNPTANVTVNSTYIVTVVDSYGCSNSDTMSITIDPLSIVGFSINDSSQCLDSNNFTFTNTSTISSGTITYYWSFGDSNTSTNTNAVNVYNSDGSYQVYLKVTSNKGCQDSIYKYAYVRPMPVAGFSINDTAQCLSANSFSFTNSSTVSSGSIAANNWSFGDSNYSTATSPNYSYALDDTFEVKLLVTTDYGCLDSNNKTTYIYPMPMPVFSVNDSNQCFSGNNFTFTNSSSITSGSISSYLWNFGDSDTSTLLDPGHNYSTDDTFVVKMKTTSALGCVDSTSKIVYVFPMPTPGFTINDSNQCQRNNSFIFTNSTTITSGTISTYQWTFGDNNSSNLTSPSHSYATDDTFQVKIVANSALGCSDSITKTTYVFPMPFASFTISDTSLCFDGNNFYFTNNSTISSGAINSYNWYFGDTDTSTQENPNHNYSLDDTFNVKIVATSTLGCVDSTIKTVYVYPMPIADFTISDSNQCLSQNSFSFTSTSTVSTGTIGSYIWYFGDGDTSSMTNPGHAYSTDDTFTVKMLATSSLGCQDSISKTTYVFPMPDPDFTISDSNQCFRQNNFSFTNASSITSGSISSYLWYFGDGDTSTIVNPNHIYSNDDTFEVKIIATSALACVDSISKTTYVFPMPVTDFTINDSSQCFALNNFIFTDNTTISSGSIGSYLWTFGDNNSSTLMSPSHAYSTEDTFIAKVVTTSAFGCADSTTKTTYVFPMPVPGFSINDSNQCFSQNNFIFTDSSNISSGSINFYLWIFGDGATSTLMNPGHVYSVDDTFEVKVVTTSALGCMDSISQIAYVFPMPVSSFSINDSNQCISQNNFLFTNNSSITSGSISSYLWSFGDGDTSTQINPGHFYIVDDTFEVKIVATSALGCVDSTSRTTYVFPMPVSDFSINDSNQCFAQNDFSFTDNTVISSGSISSYLWYFGDGNTSTLINPNHVYQLTDDTFTVKIVATSAMGCMDSSSKTTYVLPMPVPDFSINDSNQCFGQNNFIFTDNSSITSGSLSSFLWSFGDGDTSSQVSPVHVYAIDDTFEVKVIVASTFGCIDSISKQTYVFPMPQSDFSINDSGQCLTANNFSFTNTSTITSGSISSFMWDFGDGNTSILENPDHSYSSDSTFDVSSIVTSALGCVDSFIKNISVFPMPAADFSINDDGQCFDGNDFTFTDNSTIKSGNISLYQWDFGNGNTSTQTNPNNNYSTDDTFTVKLAITSDLGCPDSVSKTVYIFPMPVTSFLIDDSTQCLDNNLFTFTNNSTISTGSISSYLWKFEDGDTSTLENPQHSYASDGTFDVYLFATSVLGCADTTVKSVYVYPIPDIDLGNDTTITTRDTFILDAGSGYQSYLWNDSSTNQTLIIDGSATGKGTFIYIAAVIDANSCSGSDTIIITIVWPDGFNESTPETIIKIFPNPYNNYTNIVYDLYKTSKVSIEVFNIVGIKVTGIVNSIQQPGKYNYQFSAKAFGYAEGLYFLRFRIDGTEIIRKLVEVK